MSDEVEARLAVTAGVLNDALAMLTVHQRSTLADRLDSLFADADELWPVATRTDFQQALMDEYEAVGSRLRSRAD